MWGRCVRKNLRETIFIIVIIIIIVITIITVITIIIIIITRPKPAYGRHGLAGLWGHDTDEVLNVSLRACGAQLGFNQPGTINETTLKTMETNQKL